MDGGTRGQGQNCGHREGCVGRGYLCEGAGSALYGELCVTELTVAGVGGGEPPLQAALVHGAQGARAVTGRQEALAGPPFVADAADGSIAGRQTTGTLRINYISTYDPVCLLLPLVYRGKAQTA